MPRPDTSKQLWIEKGYEHFAQYGPQNISINSMSKEIGSPRASFYHHFGDLEIFINLLLETHLEAIKSFVQEGKEYCDCLLPDFYQLLEKYTLGLKFHRQIFLNRHLPIFGYIFSEVESETSKEFVLDLFIKEYDLNLKDDDVSKIWFTLTESWYSRIDPEQLQAEEMQRIAEEVNDSIVKFMIAPLYEKLS